MTVIFFSRRRVVRIRGRSHFGCFKAEGAVDRDNLRPPQCSVGVGRRPGFLLGELRAVGREGGWNLYGASRCQARIFNNSIFLPFFLCYPFVRPGASSFRSLIAAANASVFFLTFFHFLLLLDRAAGILPPRPRLGAPSHPGRTLTGESTPANWMIAGTRDQTGCEFDSSPSLPLRGPDVAAGFTVLYAVQGRWPQHGPQVSTPLCPERASQSDAERIARSSRPVPAGRRSAARCGEAICAGFERSAPSASGHHLFIL
jgi:hypothetical protein